MLLSLDHLVVLVRDLDRAVEDYGTLGFEVKPGGEHADGLTRNALIPFEDGSYLELVAFVDPEDTRDNVWGWRPFLNRGGGLIDYCAASGDLGADVRRLEDLGFDVEGPTQGGRRLPDGAQIGWRIARVRQDGRLLPFLIEDLTPRELRVPATVHPNGARGVSRLEIAAPDAAEAAGSLAALIGARGASEGPLRLGGCTLVPVAPIKSDAARRRLEAAGQGPLSVGLAADAQGGELDLHLSHGVGIRLLRPG